MLVAQGKLRGGAESYRDSLAIARRLAAADPGNAGWQRDLSVSYNKVGDVLVAQGNLREALQVLPRQPRDRRAARQPRPQQRRLAARSVGRLQQDRRRAGGAGQAARGAEVLPRQPRHPERLAAATPATPAGSAISRCRHDKIGDVLVAQGNLRRGAQGLPRQPRHPRAAGRRRPRQYRLAARPVGRPTTRSATCWWRRAISTRR